jgi:hypothetical protein
MTTTPTTHPDDITCAALIVDDFASTTREGLINATNAMVDAYPAIDPIFALVMITHIDLIDEGDEEVIIPPLTPAALIIAANALRARI